MMTTKKRNPKNIFLNILIIFVAMIFIGSMLHAFKPYAWGGNNYGELGTNNTIDSNIPIIMSSVTQDIDSFGKTFWEFITFFDNSGLAWGIGWNTYGQLGDGTNTDSNIPVQVSGLTNVIKLISSDASTYALKSDGTVWSWGRNNYGQLGDNTNTDSNIPVQVSGLTNIIDISSGGTTGYALKSDGIIWSWGQNNFGQLGDGTNTNSNIPVQVSGLTNIISISASYYSGYALKSDGTVWSWGQNGYGQLGDGTNTNSNIPVQVSGLTDVINISGSDSTGYALKSDGTVWSWGRNNYGQLGDGTNTDSNIPVQVSGLTNIIDISSGRYHSLVLESDGTVWSWGRNNYGQLGDNTNTDSNIPVQVSGLTRIIKIKAGGISSYALQQDPINIFNPVDNPLYTFQSYDWNLEYQDSDYNSDYTYKYTFGFDTDNNLENGVISTLITNQSLAITDTNINYYDINYTPQTSDINTGLYSWIRVDRYLSGIYDSNVELISSTTFNIVKDTVGNMYNPSGTIYATKEYTFDLNYISHINDSNWSYKYDFGTSIDNSTTTNKYIIDEDVNIIGTTTNTIDINHTFDYSQVGDTNYSFVTIKRYKNGSYFDSETFWSSSTFTVVDNITGSLAHPSPKFDIVIPTIDYNWVLTYRDYVYNTNYTYNYTIGINTTNSFNGGELDLKTGSLDVSDNLSNDYNIESSMPDSWHNKSVYIYITVDSNSGATKTFWTTSTIDVNYGMIKLTFYDENTSVLLDDNVSIIDATNGITYHPDTNGVFQEYLESMDWNGYVDSTVTRSVSSTQTHVTRKLQYYWDVYQNYDWNILMLPYGYDYPTTFQAKTPDDVIWANKYLGFRKNDSNYDYILIGKTDSTGDVSTKPLADGNYTAVLFDTNGDIVYTYEKTTVTVKKPLDEETLDLISPYDVYVDGALNQSYQNITDANITFNIFAGTESYYPFTVVDYNANPSDRNYVERGYTVRVPQGVDYTTNYIMQPYLLKITDAIVPKIYILDQLRNGVPNALVLLIKKISGETVVVESGLTLSTGALSISAYSLDKYFLQVYYNDEQVGNFVDQFRESTDERYYVIDIFATTDISNLSNILGDFSNTQSIINTSEDINYIIKGDVTINYGDFTSYTITIKDEDDVTCDFYSTTVNGQTININQTFNINHLPSDSQRFNAIITANYIIDGVAGSKEFNVVLTNNKFKVNVFTLLSDVPRDLGTVYSIILAIMLTAFVLFGLTKIGNFGESSRNAIAIIGVLFLGIFSMLGWFNVGVVIFGVDIGQFTYILLAFGAVYLLLGRR